MQTPQHSYQAQPRYHRQSQQVIQVDWEPTFEDHLALNNSTAAVREFLSFGNRAGGIEALRKLEEELAR